MSFRCCRPICNLDGPGTPILFGITAGHSHHVQGHQYVAAHGQVRQFSSTPKKVGETDTLLAPWTNWLRCKTSRCKIYSSRLWRKGEPLLYKFGMIKAYLKIRNLLISQKSVRKVWAIVFGVGRKGTPTWHGKIRSSPHFFPSPTTYTKYLLFSIIQPSGVHFFQPYKQSNGKKPGCFG